MSSKEPETSRGTGQRIGVFVCECGRNIAGSVDCEAVRANAEQLDGVVASQQFATHFSLLPELYGHVKHVFTEKPLAVSVAAAESLTRAAAEAGCVHMVGYHKRSDPATEHTKAVIGYFYHGFDGLVGQAGIGLYMTLANGREQRTFA